MDVAKRFAQISSARRLQVGAIVVKDDRIISIGYNGMPAGWDNNCENKVYFNEGDHWNKPSSWVDTNYPFEDSDGKYHLKSKPEVLHAERNALDKLARTHESGTGASMFVTHSPCMECAKSIYGAGITTLYYDTEYRSTEGIEFLKQCGVTVRKLEPIPEE